MGGVYGEWHWEQAQENTVFYTLRTLVRWAG
jgi:hypothetical protein